MDETIFIWPGERSLTELDDMMSFTSNEAVPQSDHDEHPSLRYLPNMSILDLNFESGSLAVPGLAIDVEIATFSQPQLRAGEGGFRFNGSQVGELSDIGGCDQYHHQYSSTNMQTAVLEPPTSGSVLTSSNDQCQPLSGTLSLNPTPRKRLFPHGSTTCTPKPSSKRAKNHKPCSRENASRNPNFIFIETESLNQSMNNRHIESQKAIALLEASMKPFSIFSRRKATVLIGQFKQLIQDEMLYGNSNDDLSDSAFASAPSSSDDSLSCGISEASESEYRTDDTSISDVPSQLSQLSQDLQGDVGTSFHQGHPPQTQSGFKPLYCCTRKDCSYSVHSFTDWKRHEEGEKHWPQERFMCLQYPTPVSDPNGSVSCQFCLVPYHHLTSTVQTHYLQCPSARNHGKTFGRKDHLVEHLQKDHGMNNISLLAATWKYHINSNWPRQCGFCGQRFQDWNQRMRHVAKHYQDGSNVASWKLPFPRPKDPEFQRMDDESDDDDDDDFGDNNGHSRQKAIPLQNITSEVTNSQAQNGQSITNDENGSRSQGGHRERAFAEDLLDGAERDSGSSGIPRKYVHKDGDTKRSLGSTHNSRQTTKSETPLPPKLVGRQKNARDIFGPAKRQPRRKKLNLALERYLRDEEDPGFNFGVLSISLPKYDLRPSIKTQWGDACNPRLGFAPLGVSPSVSSPLLKMLDRISHHSTVENPLAIIPAPDLAVMVGSFGRDHQLDESLFRRSAFMAQDPHIFKIIEDISESERLLRPEMQPRSYLLFLTILACCLCGATRGWQQTHGQNYSTIEAIDYVLCTGMVALVFWRFEPFDSWMMSAWMVPLESIFVYLSFQEAYSKTWLLALLSWIVLKTASELKEINFTDFTIYRTSAYICGALAAMSWQLSASFEAMLGLSTPFAHLSIDGIGWHLQFASVFIPVISLLVGLYFSPECPRLLVKRGNYWGAYESYLELRQSSLLAVRDLYYIHAQLQLEAEQTLMKKRESSMYSISTRFLKDFTDPRYRRAALASAVVMLSQHICFGNMIAFYSSILFRDTIKNHLSTLLLVSWCRRIPTPFPITLIWFKRLATCLSLHIPGTSLAYVIALALITFFLGWILYQGIRTGICWHIAENVFGLRLSHKRKPTEENN